MEEDVGILKAILSIYGQILCPFGTFCGHLVYLVSCTEKNKATLVVGSCKCSSRRIGSTGTKLKEMGG
jgi:hypothetical protein